MTRIETFAPDVHAPGRDDVVIVDCDLAAVDGAVPGDGRGAHVAAVFCGTWPTSRQLLDAVAGGLEHLEVRGLRPLVDMPAQDRAHLLHLLVTAVSVALPVTWAAGPDPSWLPADAAALASVPPPADDVDGYAPWQQRHGAFRLHFSDGVTFAQVRDGRGAPAPQVQTIVEQAGRDLLMHLDRGPAAPGRWDPAAAAPLLQRDLAVDVDGWLVSLAHPMRYRPVPYWSHG